MKILLVDDGLVNRRKLENCLKKIIPDALFLHAENGAEGIDLADREHPDVIFLDDLMPSPEGCWACSEIRINEKKWPEGKRAFIVTYSSTYVNDAYSEDKPQRFIYPEADSFHPKDVNNEKLRSLFRVEYPEWLKKQTPSTKTEEPTPPAAGAGGGTGEAVPPLVPHDAVTAVVTGEEGRLAMSPPSQPLTLARTPFGGRLSAATLPAARSDAPSLRRSPALAAAGQSSFWKEGDELRSLSPSIRTAPRLLDTPTARLPRSAASSPMLFDKKKTLAAAPTGAPAPTAEESTTLGGVRA